MNSQRHGGLVAFVFYVAWLTALATSNWAKPQDSPTNDAVSPPRLYTDTEPLFRVVQGGKWGYMDKSGKVVIPPSYEDAYPHNEGYAIVQLSHDVSSGMVGVYMQKERVMLCFINKSGRQVGSVYPALQPFSEGLALVADPVSRSWSFIDKSGNVLLSGYKDAKPFSEGLAAVGLPGEVGYIDTVGKSVISAQYSEGGTFKEGLAAVKVDKKWGYIDRSGKMVVSPQFDDVLTYTEGLAAVKFKGKWGYIDKTGQTVIPPQFAEALGFSEGLADVKDGGKWGYIDKTGRRVISPQFEQTHSHLEGLASVRMGNGVSSTSRERW
jgi:hypothetical protein